MDLPRTIDVRQAKDAEGDAVGPGPWHEVTQSQVDLFAESTGDDQWIHVDVERATSGPFGATIAHGFLTLSLLPVLFRDLVVWEHRTMGVNYGLDRVRFLTPVRVGARVRATVVLAEVVVRPDGSVLVTQDVTVEVEGAERPACVARQLSLLHPVRD